MSNSLIENQINSNSDSNIVSNYIVNSVASRPKETPKVQYVNKHQQVIVGHDKKRHPYNRPRVDHNPVSSVSRETQSLEETKVSPTEEDAQGGGSGRSRHRGFKVVRGRKSSHRDVKLHINFNSMFYTRWSDWGNCSSTCLTSRYRYVVTAADGTYDKSDTSVAN